MSEIIPLPQKQRRLWICQCGCSSFDLLDDGSASCAACEEPAHSDAGGWFTDVDSGSDRPEGLDPPFNDIQGNGSVEFARRRIEAMTRGSDVVGIVCLRSNGAISTWTEADTGERVRWVCDQLDAAKALFSKHNKDDA